MLIAIKPAVRQCQIWLSWWRYPMETFFALLALCAWNLPGTGEFPSQRPVTRSFDVLFDLPLNKCLSKQSCGWWFETPSRPLWRHCTVTNWGSRLSCGWLCITSPMGTTLFALEQGRNHVHDSLGCLLILRILPISRTDHSSINTKRFL